MIVVLSGPSGVGKRKTGTLIRRRYAFTDSTSATTRRKRDDETHGIEYFFLADREFATAINGGKFAEYAYIHGKGYYGTYLKTVEEALAKGENLFFEVDVSGHASLRTIFAGRDDVVFISIFLMPPGETEQDRLTVLRSRILERNPSESEEEIVSRLTTARDEMPRAIEYTHTIVNGAFKDTEAAVVAILDQALPVALAA